jgi:hypothetical protein
MRWKLLRPVTMLAGVLGLLALYAEPAMALVHQPEQHCEPLVRRS